MKRFNTFDGKITDKHEADSYSNVKEETNLTPLLQVNCSEISFVLEDYLWFLRNE